MSLPVPRIIYTCRNDDVCMCVRHVLFGRGLSLAETRVNYTHFSFFFFFHSENYLQDRRGCVDAGGPRLGCCMPSSYTHGSFFRSFLTALSRSARRPPRTQLKRHVTRALHVRRTNIKYLIMLYSSIVIIVINRKTIFRSDQHEKPFTWFKRVIIIQYMCFFFQRFTTDERFDRAYESGALRRKKKYYAMRRINY